MGSQSSKQSLTKADLESVLARERVLSAARLKQELLAQQAQSTRAAEPTITKADLELALERERVLVAARLKKELSVQQAPAAFAPTPPEYAIAQTGTPMAVNIYPELKPYSNHMPPLVTVPLQQTNAPFAPHVRALPSAPVFDNNDELPKQSNTRPNAQSIKNEAKCSTCKNFFGSYIYTCTSGHSACEKCRMEHRTCGICKSTITSNRNFRTNFPKHVKETQVVSCPNKNAAYSMSTELAEARLDALKKVTFKEFMCPLGPILGICYWKGTLSSMPAHVTSEHPENCAAVNQEITIDNLTSHSHKVYFVSLGHYIFFVHIMTLLDGQKICMTVQLFGTQDEASKWDYEFHVYKKSDKRIKYKYTDVCHPHSTEIAQIISSNKCAVLPSVYYRNFVNSGTITCKFFCKKRFESIKSNRKETSNETKGRNYNRNRRNNSPIPS